MYTNVLHAHVCTSTKGKTAHLEVYHTQQLYLKQFELAVQKAVEAKLTCILHINPMMSWGVENKKQHYFWTNFYLIMYIVHIK